MNKEGALIRRVPSVCTTAVAMATDFMLCMSASGRVWGQANLKRRLSCQCRRGLPRTPSVHSVKSRTVVNIGVRLVTGCGHAPSIVAQHHPATPQQSGPAPRHRHPVPLPATMHSHAPRLTFIGAHCCVAGHGTHCSHYPGLRALQPLVVRASAHIFPPCHVWHTHMVQHGGGCCQHAHGRG